MRVLMIAHSGAPWTPHFARFFAGRGDVLRVVSFAPNPLDGVEGIDMVFVGIEPYDMTKNKHMFFTRAPRVRRILREFQPDVVFAPYLVSNGLTAALAWRGPLVVSAVGGDVLDQAGRRGLRRRFREAMIRYVCRRADVINTVSQALTDELIRLGVPESKLFQLPFGADLDGFQPAADMPREPARRFICTRKHEPLYDIPTVIDALARLKAQGRRFHCTFTCGGTRFEEYRARAESAGLQDCTRFTGDLPFRELPALLREADIYISASRSDGTSVALLEAMASGLVPVVSKIPANEPWVEHGRTGMLFECGQPADLAAALDRAMEDAELRRCAFEHNRQRVHREADREKNMQVLADVLERLVKQRARR